MKLWLLLLNHFHEFSVELRILNDSLAQLGELGVVQESSEVGSTTGVLARVSTAFFIAIHVLITLHVATLWHLWDAS